ARPQEKMVMSMLRGMISAALLLAAPVALADPPASDPTPSAREVAMRAPTASTDIEEEVQTLVRTVAELQEKGSRLSAAEAARPERYDVGDLNQHKNWP